ncbi:DUF3306 domain-containing protein [Rhodobacteraceae bacterium F11138]|nr:DUF3306 domain-containing protein [Rhodobacteraceae bacterium F11138]
MSGANDFWSRRRAAVQAEQDAEAQTLAARAEAEQQADLDARDDAQILADLNLPDPEDLVLGDDIRGFMTKAVPDRLRRRALRRLWRLNPVLANLDGLVDYGEDYTDSATVVENLQTAYQVGKGMMAHLQEMARDTDETDAPPPDEPLPAVDPVPAATPDSTQEEPETILALEHVEPEAPPTASVPRRMQFDFSACDTDNRRI